MADALEFRVNAIVAQAVKELQKVNTEVAKTSGVATKAQTGFTGLGKAVFGAEGGFRKIGASAGQIFNSFGQMGGALGNLVNGLINASPAVAAITAAFGAFQFAVSTLIDYMKELLKVQTEVAASQAQVGKQPIDLLTGYNNAIATLFNTQIAGLMRYKEIAPLILQMQKEYNQAGYFNMETMNKLVEAADKLGMRHPELLANMKELTSVGVLKEYLKGLPIVLREAMEAQVGGGAGIDLTGMFKGIVSQEKGKAGKAGKDYSSLYALVEGAGFRGVKKTGAEAIPDMKEAITNIANAGEVLSKFQIDLLYFRDALEEGIGAPLNDIFGDNFKTLLDDSFGFLQVKLDETDAGFKKFFGNVWNTILDLATKVVTSAFIQIAVNLVKMLIPGGTSVSWGSSILNAVLAGLGIGGFDNPANDDIARKFGKDFIQHLTNGMRGAMPKSGLGQGQPIIIQVTQPGLLRQADFIVGSNPSEQRLFNRALRRVAEAGA